jgi:hypothetical protein
MALPTTNDANLPLSQTLSNEKSPPSIDVSLNTPSLLDVPGYDSSFAWDAAEERAAVRKADCCILSFVVLLFVFMQFDRTNLSNALTDGLRQDINIGTKQINTATTLFTLGFVITELPFNMISKRLGPENFLPVTMLLWGVCTWAQVFLQNRNGLWALRFFIGALEGGYIPGR